MKSNAERTEPEKGKRTKSENDLKSLPMPEMLKRLDSSPDGLSQAEAQKRPAQYGPNEIKEQKDIGGEICYTNSRH